MAEENAKRLSYEELLEKNLELEEKLKGRENREYKSRLFSFLFGREENKEWRVKGKGHGGYLLQALSGRVRLMVLTTMKPRY